LECVKGFCGPGASFSRGLHYAIGVDPDLLPGHDHVILYPWGFRVVESPVFPRGRGWLHYLMVKRLVSSVAAAGRLASRLRCREWRVAGLKDTCSVSAQLVSLRGCMERPVRVEAGRVEGRLLGVGGPLRPGLLEGNLFTVDLEGGGCRGAGWAPNFYGPQRFGVERPVSHVYGLYSVRGDHAGLARFYRARMPLEARSCPGGYEAAHLSGAWRGSPRRPPGVAVEALQAYLFNRALSRALRRGLEPRSLAEHWLEYPCPGGSRARLPAARLPSPRLASGRSVWARLVREVAEEEGVDLRGLPRGGWRPLAVAPCTWRCRVLGGAVRLRFSLPPGAYATTLLDHVYGVDWLSSWGRCPGAFR